MVRRAAGPRSFRTRTHSLVLALRRDRARHFRRFSLWISYDLHTGIESERWHEEQIERFRATFNTPLAVGVYATLTIAAFFFLFFDLMSHHHAHESGYGLLLLLQNLSQLQMAARRPKLRTPGQRIDWRSAPPITSDHWGEHT